MSRAPPEEPWQSDAWQRVTGLAPTSRWQRIGAAAVGALALAGAVVVAAGLGGGSVASLAGPARLFVYFVANVGLAVAGWSIYRGRAVDRAETEAETTLPPPDATADWDEPLVGGDVDAVLERLVDPGEHVEGWEYVDVRNTIRSVAVDVIRREADTGSGDIADALDGGTWTDDPRAAAYLGDVEPPLRTRVVDWASGDPERRRIEATVRELAALADVETEVASP